MTGTSALAAEQFSNTNLIEWDEDNVNEWLSSIGFPQYYQHIIDNGISGEILSLLDHESLKEVGVHSVGQRLAILREVYYLKVAHGIAIEPEHYVPPSEAIHTSGQEGMSLDRLHDLMKELGERTRVLEQENRRLADSLNFVMDQLAMVKTHDDSETTLRHQVSFGPTLNGHSAPHTPGLARSNTRDPIMVESPQLSPARLDHDACLSIASQVVKSSKLSPTPHAYEQARTPTDKLHTQSHLSQNQQNTSSVTKNAKETREPPSSSSNVANAPAENHFKSFKVSLEDPCWKVLPAALKKYKINDDWRKYVMFICHGSTERCLSYDEKPLLLFQKLKDANKNPVFMLRHIKDIRSPIAVAQQKQTQHPRDNPAGVNSGPVTPGGSRSGPAPTPGSSSAATSGSSPAYSRNTRLHQPPVLHPISAQAQAAKTAEANAAAGLQGLEPHSEEPSPHPNISESLAASNSHGTSHAIAIYPYTAEQDDEFDVAVDDTFIIRSREKGWWVVQRDIAGTGAPSHAPEDAPKWIPAGCLLETTLPPSQAMQETRIAVGSSLSPSASPVSTAKKAILPPHIVSTSFPGITLMPYEDKGDHELSLARGDVLRVFKRYNHWSYAIKEETGERGWVPSWFIGKHTPGSTGIPPSLVPPTPTSGSTGSSTSAHQHQHGVASPGEMPSAELPPFTGTNGAATTAGMNGSPMSQAFPASSQQPTGGPHLRAAVALI